MERFRELGDKLGQVTKKLSTPISDLLLSPVKLSKEVKEHRSPGAGLIMACLFGAMEGFAIGDSILRGDPHGWVAFRAIFFWEAENVLSLPTRYSLSRERRIVQSLADTKKLIKQIEENIVRLKFPTIHNN